MGSTGPTGLQGETGAPGPRGLPGPPGTASVAAGAAPPSYGAPPQPVDLPVYNTPVVPVTSGYSSGGSGVTASAQLQHGGGGFGGGHSHFQQLNSAPQITPPRPPRGPSVPAFFPNKRNSDLGSRHDSQSLRQILG